jgi:N-acetylglutamate synthase-like GNAT family acetyltransferase
MIRQFRPEDALPCCELIHACLAKDSSLSPGLREQLLSSETPQTMVERSRLFYVAIYESDDGILGIAGLDMNEIRLLFVSPEHRRSGIGRALLGFIHSMVPGILFQDIFVYSSLEGMEFYKNCGFIEKGPVNFEIGGELLRTIFMSLPLR